MLFEALRLVLVVTLLVVLPGHLLLNALLPRGALRRMERAYLTLASGVLVLVTVGAILGLLPHGDQGHFSTLGSGAPTLEVAMLAVMAAFFWIGLHRGAYPGIARRYPQLLALGGRTPSAQHGR